MVLGDELSTVLFTREGKISPNWTDLVQHISQSGVPENIDLKDTWFTPDPEEDPSKPPSPDTSIALKNNNKMLISLQLKPHVQEIYAIKK